MLAVAKFLLKSSRREKRQSRTGSTTPQKEAFAEKCNWTHANTRGKKLKRGRVDT